MKNKILSYLLGGVFAVLLGFGGLGGSYVSAGECIPKEDCDGISLNTCFPIIGNCIGGENEVDSTTAFPTMIGALTKIAVSLVLVVCFILVIYAGILWAADKPTDAKKWLKRVAITVLLLGFSGSILRLINPNFFS